MNNALLVETEEQEYYPEKLTRQNLQEIAKYVNNTYIHYSGNCVLLAACLHYNLHYRKDILVPKTLHHRQSGYQVLLLSIDFWQAT
nr:T3SS effector cysteine hydrolase SpvD family protein [Arsenophonus endosymbiont of Aleurodicus floccissimus]